MYPALRRQTSLNRSPSSSSLFRRRYSIPALTRPMSSPSTVSNLHKPKDWKSRAPAPLPGPTFAAQATLPKLPVPELSDTIAKLKESLRPIAWSGEEYAEAVKKIDEFASTLGPELQKRLVKRREETDHWFEEWWDELAYMAYRDSVSSFPASVHSSRQNFILNILLYTGDYQRFLLL